MSRTRPYCGKSLEDGARFCKHCGRKLDGTAAGSTAPAPTARKVRSSSATGAQAGRYSHALEKGRTRTYDAGSSSVVISRDSIQVHTSKTQHHCHR